MRRERAPFDGGSAALGPLTRLERKVLRRTASGFRADATHINRWLRHYNQERPHEALSQQTLAQHWHKSRRKYRGVRPERHPRRQPVRLRKKVSKIS